jgi:hypothetical protein
MPCASHRACPDERADRRPFQIEPQPVTRYNALVSERICTMAAAAERMKAMRARRRADGLREVRITVPDPESEIIRTRIERQVKALTAASENEALDWIESVSEFDEAR